MSEEREPASPTLSGARSGGIGPAAASTLAEIYRFVLDSPDGVDEGRGGDVQSRPSGAEESERG